MAVTLWYGEEAIEISEDLQKYIVMPFILVGAITAVLGLFLTLIYYVINLIDNFQPKIIFMTLGVVILYGISYALASGAVPEYYPEGISKIESKQVGSGLILFYSLIITAILAIIYTEVSKIFSK